MGIESLSKLKSQLSFAERLSKTLLDDEAFALLTGDSGSGRTTMCEQVVNLADGKCLAIFVPCHKEMTIEQLRELFLQQLLPGQDWDLSNKLADTLVALHIPTPQKILVVADDLDEVVSGFFDELVQIASDFQGQNRFSFLITGHPLWAQSKLTQNLADLTPTEWQMPLVTMEEAMQLCKSAFSAKGLLPVYKEINGKLPYKLEQCQGNIGKILKLTEILMAKPDKVNDQSAAVEDTVNVEMGTKKKRSSVVIFITIICLVIALACMVPLFLGGSFFKSIFGSSDGDGMVQTTQLDESDEGSPQGIDPFADGPAGGESDDGEAEPGDFEDEAEAQDGGKAAANKSGSKEQGSSKGKSKEQNKADEAAAEQSAEPKAGAASKSRKQQAEQETEALDSILADEPRGTADEAFTDDGQLLEDAQGGVEAETPAKTTTKSVTLSGETLEQIEKQGADSQESDRPRRTVEGSVDKKPEPGEATPKAAPETAPAAAAPAAPGSPSGVVVLKREDNALRMEEQRKAAEAEAKAKEEAQKAATAKREAEEIAKAEERIRKEEAQKQQTATAVVKLNAPAPSQKSTAQHAAAKPQATPAAQQSNTSASSTRKASSTSSAQVSPATIYARNVPSSGSAVPGNTSELTEKDRNHYTLQVVASRDRAAVADVAAAIAGKYWIYETVRENKPWFVLITGDYGSAQEAIRAVGSLPRSLRGAGPFAKSFGTVRSEMDAR